MYLKTFTKTVVAVAAALAFTATASANLLTNPSFETPDTGGAPPEYFGATGWSDFGGGTFTIEDFVAGIPAADGNQVLKTFGLSGVFQEFAVAPGDIVDATAVAMNGSYDPMAAHQVAAGNIEWFSSPGVCLDVGSGCVISFGAAIDGATAALDTWTPVGVIGAAVPAGATIGRLTLITGCFGGDQTLCGGAPLFDAASFTTSAIPVPAAAWLFGSALAGLVAARRRK